MKSAAARSWLLAALLTLGSGAPDVQAQDAPAEPDAAPVEAIPVRDETEAPADAEATQLDEIIVTATKREKSVREIPGSINAMSGEMLEKLGVRELQDFMSLVPGLTLQDTAESATAFNSARKLSIRGVGPSDGANQTTGLLFGDISLSDPYGSYATPDVDPFDLATVEVLKGPQGTLFGASALNGAIRYVPNPPEFGVWQGRGFVEWRTTKEGSPGAVYATALNVPIGDALAVRAVGLLQRSGGLYDVMTDVYQEVDADRSDKWTGRATTRWEATDRLNVNLLYMRQEFAKDGLSGADNAEGRFQNSAQSPSSLLLEFDVTNLDVRYDFDWATLVSATARTTRFRDTDVDSSTLFTPPAPDGTVTRSFTRADIESYAQEFRLVSPDDDGPWDWLGGVSYSLYENFAEIDVYSPDEGGGAVLTPIFGSTATTARGASLINGYLGPRPLTAKELAVFGEATRTLGERWAVTLGGRYYQAHLSSDLHLEGPLVVATFGRSPYDQYYETDQQGFSPKLAATFQATRDILAYASLARGFQYGGVNVYPSIDPQYELPLLYDSSTVWSYELGVRTDWLQRTLRLDLTAFWIDWQDPQILQQAPGMNITSYVDNVGGARSQGLEATFLWFTPIPGVSFTEAAAYIVAKTTEPYTGVDGAQVPAGVDMPAAPRVQSTTTLAYNASFGDWMTGASVLLSYQGKAYNNIAHQQEIYEYATLAMNLDVGRPDIRFQPTLTLSCTNLTDVHGLNTYAIGGTTGETVDVGYNRPRTISVRLGASF